MDGWVDGWTYVRIYVCMYVCMSVSMYDLACVYAYIYVCTYLCIYTHIYIWIEPRETGKTADEIDTLDTLRHRVIMMTNIEAAVDELHEIMDHACRSSFRQAGKKGKEPKYKSIPWWTSRLTL